MTHFCLEKSQTWKQKAHSKQPQTQQRMNDTGTLKFHSKIAWDNTLKYFYFSENIRQHFIRIVRLADDSHEISSFIFMQKY